MTRTPEDTHSHFDSPPPWGSTDSPKNATNPLMTRAQDYHKAKRAETQHFFWEAEIPGVFNPVNLFANDEEGFFLDFSDMGSLFQDSEGLVPVTAPGDPVGAVFDKTANKETMRQISAVSRPIYVETNINGKRYYGLKFDGADDFMETITGLDLTAVQDTTTAAGLECDAAAVQTYPVSHGANIAGPDIALRAATGGLNALTEMSNAVNIIADDLGALPRISATLGDHSLTKGSSTIVTRRGTFTQGGGVTGGFFLNDAGRIGGRTAVSGQFPGTIWGGALMIGRGLTTDERSNLYSWIDARTPPEGGTQQIGFDTFGPYTHTASSTTFWVRYPTGAVADELAWQIGFNIDSDADPDVWANLVMFLATLSGAQRAYIRNRAVDNGWTG